MSEALFESDFDRISNIQWMDKIVKDLKGGSFEKLNWNLDEHTLIEPFYTIERNKDFDTPIHQEIISKIVNPSWKIIQNINAASSEEYEKALDSGVDVIQVNEKQFLLNKPSFRCSVSSKQSLKSIKSKYSKIRLVTNPINHWVNGDSPKLNLELLNEKGIEIGVSGLAFHNAGADDFLESALILSSLNEYLHYLKSSDPKSLENRKISIEIAIGINFYLGIAKIRAIRILMSQLLKEYALKNLSISINAVTSPYYNSHKDRYTNLLRHTTMGLAAVIGNVDGLIITPFEKENPFSNRLARNIQHLLKEESYMDKVMDMMSGSYFMEELTLTFIDKTWNEFLRIEEEGGFINNMRNGSIKVQINKQHSDRLAKINSEKRTMIGVNKYQIENEEIVDNEADKPASKEPWVLDPITLSKEI